MRLRRSTRCPNRSAVRRITRSSVRVRWRGPDLLGKALTAYRRAILAYRKLARLAPHHFNSAVVDRERRAREERRRWMATWEPALEKAYGPPTPAEREAQRLAELRADEPPALSPGLVRRVEAELATRQLWLETGRQALALHQQRYPHHLPSLSRIARLLDIGFTFRRIATGMDELPVASTPPAPAAPDWEEQIRRAYGGAPQSAATTAVSPRGIPPPTEPAIKPAPSVSVANAPSQTLTPPPGAVPPAPAPQRRDAWSRLARQLRTSASSRPTS